MKIDKITKVLNNVFYVKIIEINSKLEFVRFEYFFDSFTKEFVYSYIFRGIDKIKNCSPQENNSRKLWKTRNGMLNHFIKELDIEEMLEEFKEILEENGFENKIGWEPRWNKIQ